MAGRKTRENDKAVTRNAIEAEAKRLIDEGGVNALSISKIAKTLKMTHGNIYRHFPSKNALAAEIAATWMRDMREACENAIADEQTVQGQLMALVTTIRGQLILRADHPDAFSIFHYVLEHKPAEAIAHHIHRQDLVVSIMTNAGWPKNPITENEALTILDGLRFFTDPYAMSAYRGQDMTSRIKKVVEMLSRYIEQNATPPKLRDQQN